MAAGVIGCPSCGVKNRLPVGAAGRPRCASCHGDLPWIVAAGDGDIADALDTTQLVIVDLWARWCGPCRMVAPILERLAHEFAGRVKVVKVDVDAAPLTAERWNARSIPMMLFVRGGEVVNTVVGAQPEHVLRTLTNRYLDEAA